MGENGEKKDYIAVMNCIAAFAVVILHTNGRFFWEYSGEPYWDAANIIEEVFLFAVPLFFMLSGATLLDYAKRYDTKTYFKKRIKKTVIPYLCWCIVGLLWNILLGVVPLAQVGPRKILWAFLEHGGMTVYWFFAPLFSVYLCIPLFAAVKDKKKVFSYIVAASLIVNQLIPFLLQFMSVEGSWSLSMPVTYSYLIFALTGYLLSRCELRKAARGLIYAGGACRTCGYDRRYAERLPRRGSDRRQI